MYALRRLGQAVVSLLVASAGVWALMAFAPGDPAVRILLARGITEPAPEQVAALRGELGLDRPYALRYLDWMRGLARGDLGLSWTTGRPIADEFLARLPATGLLAAVALLLALAVTLALGVPAAAWASRWPDRLARGAALVALAAPPFLVGVLLIEVVTLRLGLGRVLADGTARTVLLPALTLALGPAASWSRLLRTSLLEARAAPHLAVAAGRGATPGYLLTRHLLPHAAPPMLTVIGLSAAALLGGAPVVETVFTWPGVGLYTVQAIETRDLPVVAATAVFAVVAYLVVSFLTDVTLTAADPRRRAGT